MPLNLEGFTPTQVLILELLADGQPHAAQEIKDVALDSLSELGALYVHIFHLRRRLAPRGETILTEYRRSGSEHTVRGTRFYYRWVRLLSAPSE